LSSLTEEIADAQRELLAIKSGFSGTSAMFTGATVTTQSFTLTPTTSMLITVAFEYKEYPEMYVTGQRLAPPGGVFVGYAQRRSLYEWYIEYQPYFGTMQWDCILISEHPPLSFTLVEVS
jgi:hypothetical protein